MEELSAGLNHAMIGSKIAEKWNFPPSLVEAIAHHHNPANSSKNTGMLYSPYTWLMLWRTSNQESLHSTR